MDGKRTRARWFEYPLVFLAFAFFVLAYAPSVGEILENRDLGVHLARAVQIDVGRHPFIDYPGGVYGPLVFYASFLAQVLSGWRLFGEVALDVCGYALAYAFLYAVFLRVGKSRTIALAALVAGALLLPRFYKYYIVLGPALYLFALESGCRRGFRLPALVGMAAASCVAGFFRLDFGAYAVLASLVVFALAAAGGTGFLRSAALYLLACLVLASPFLAALVLSTDPLRVAGDTLGLVRGAKEGLGRALDPELLDGLPLVQARFQVAFWGARLLPWSLIAVAVIRRRRFTSPSTRTFVVGSSLFTGLVFLQATHRVDPQHLLQVLPPCLVLLAWIAKNVAAALPRVPGRVAACALFAVPVVLLGDQRQRYDELPRWGELTAKLGEYELSRAELRSADTWERPVATWMTISSWIVDHVPEGENVLVVPYRPQVYYLCERGYGTRFGWLTPGLFGGRFSEERFIESLANTPVVVDEVGYAFDSDPARGARSFAPELMRELYETRAIAFGQGFVLVLVDDPELLSGAVFPSSFRRYDGEYRERPGGWFAIKTGNTLDWSVPSTLRTVRGGAFLLGGACPTRPQDRLWVLLRGEETYRAAAELQRTEEGFFFFQCMADTGAVPPGTYAVDLAVGTPLTGYRTPTERSVEVIELR